MSGRGGSAVGAGDGFRDVSEASAPASSGIGFGPVIIGRQSAGAMGDGRVESRIVRGSVASGGFGRRRIVPASGFSSARAAGGIGERRLHVSLRTSARSSSASVCGNEDSDARSSSRRSVAVRRSRRSGQSAGSYGYRVALSGNESHGGFIGVASRASRASAPICGSAAPAAADGKQFIRTICRDLQRIRPLGRERSGFS